LFLRVSLSQNRAHFCATRYKEKGPIGPFFYALRLLLRPWARRTALDDRESEIDPVFFRRLLADGAQQHVGDAAAEVVTRDMNRRQRR
jgi:hypothetical protein